MGKLLRAGSIMALLGLQLTTAGCVGGGSGAGFAQFLSNLFGGSDSSSVESTVASALSVEQLTETLETEQHRQVATLVNPEPASMALFGGGMGALAVWRRRRSKKRTS